MVSETDNPAVELQAVLAADKGGEARRRLSDALASIRADVRRQQNVGVSPSEFRVLESIDGAAEAAGTVVEAVWRRYHGDASI